jgi:hypothetical protein
MKTLNPREATPQESIPAEVSRLLKKCILRGRPIAAGCWTAPRTRVSQIAFGTQFCPTNHTGCDSQDNPPQRDVLVRGQAISLRSFHRLRTCPKRRDPSKNKEARPNPDNPWPRMRISPPEIVRENGSRLKRHLVRESPCLNRWNTQSTKLIR